MLQLTNEEYVEKLNEHYQRVVTKANALLTVVRNQGHIPDIDEL